MKRPDVRLAWREKLAIFWLVFLLNALVIFYVVEFGRSLCPNFDKAWTVNEVGQHLGLEDNWVAIQGSVYDITHFVRGDHSDIFGIPSNSLDIREALAGRDLTQFFPPPLVLACPGLVTDDTLELRYKNATADQILAIHKSGRLPTVLVHLMQLKMTLSESE